MKCSCHGPKQDPAFTLIEVMLAVALFFMAAFGILALVSQNLRTARMLQNSHLSAAMIASQLSLTNKLEEGLASGTFDELVPGLHPDFSWTSETSMVSSNGLFQIDLVVLKGGNEESSMSIMLYKPDSVVGGLTGPRRR